MNLADMSQYRDSLVDYRSMVASLRASVYLDYPKEVSIESQTVCNAACTFCPYPGLERKGTKMPDALISKIIEDLRAIPAQVPFIISPFKVNDPLLDVRLFDITAEINAKLPNASLRIFTNGSPLTEKNVGKLAAVKKVEHLWISLNHHEAEAYEKVMQLPLKRTLDNLDMLHRKKAAGEFPHPVVVSRVRDHSAVDDDFLQFLLDRYPLFGRGIIYQSEWLEQVPGLASVRTPPLVGCARWWEMSIMSTGVVSFCCMDGKGEYATGDVSKSSVLDVYNSPGYRKYRERFMTRMEGAPCMSCTHF